MQESTKIKIQYPKEMFQFYKFTLILNQNSVNTLFKKNTKL